VCPLQNNSTWSLTKFATLVTCLQLCVEGPKEKLDSTVYSQPAIYVASLAAVEKLKATEGQVSEQVVDVAVLA
jgi:malonyl CoA-acyl carrier protein transacylase